MLLFKSEHIGMIQRGVKTQTRRLWKKQRAKVGSYHKIKLKMLSREYFGFVKILSVRKEKVQDKSKIRSGSNFVCS